MIKAIIGGVEIEVLASAGASVSKVRGIHGGAVKVAVRAAPENGKANAEIEEVLAAFFDVPKRSVAVAAGHASRNKRVRIAGLTTELAKQRLDTL
jgi:uncharacterized protein (TIGR00251 family)